MRYRRKEEIVEARTTETGYMVTRRNSSKYQIGKEAFEKDFEPLIEEPVEAGPNEAELERLADEETKILAELEKEEKANART